MLFFLIFTLIIVFSLYAPRVIRHFSGHLIALLMGVLGFFSTRALIQLPSGKTLHWGISSWPLPELGIALEFSWGHFSLVITSLIFFIGAAVYLYSGGYFKKTPYKLPRYFGILSLFTLAMLGLIGSDNLFAFFIFWELTSLSSYFLISFYYEKESSKQAALQALIITAGGGLILLLGIILLTRGLYAQGLPLAEACRFSSLGVIEWAKLPHHNLILVCFILAAATKSAQWPFHFWLPGAMQAPTPVSSFLHSATMVKAGLYLLYKIYPAFSSHPLWGQILIPLGLFSFLFSAFLSLGQRDLKAALAYSTLSVLGLLTMLLGLGEEKALAAFITFFVAHALYKSTLFQWAGVIDAHYQTRDVFSLRNKKINSLLLKLLYLLPLLSLYGLPLFLGFYAKELFYGALWESPLMLVISFFATVFMVVGVTLLGMNVFGHATDIADSTSSQKLPLLMVLSPFLMGTLGLFLGLAPHTFTHVVLEPLLPHPPHLEITPHIHGTLGKIFFLSLGTIGCSVALSLYIYRKSISFFYRREDSWQRYRGRLIFESLKKGLGQGAKNITNFIQARVLTTHLKIIFSVFLLLALPYLYHNRNLLLPQKSFPLQWQEYLLISILLISTAMTFFKKKRLTRTLFLGVSGLIVTLMFVQLSAPDLGLTQLMIETLSVIVLVLIFYDLPPIKIRSNQKNRGLDFFLALLLATVIVGVLILTYRHQFPTLVGDFFIRHSQSLAHGKNIVNVILVDFRGFDTMGEVTVLVLAGVAIHALLKRREQKR